MKRDELARWLTPQEVGNMAGQPAVAIRRHIQSGKLPATSLTSRRGRQRRYRVKPEDAAAYAREAART